MNAEIIAVGTELLLGQIVNTNAQYLSRELADLGINVFYHSVVGDNEQRLYDTLSMALQRADLVITTGGLGPTQDDLTKETIAKALGLSLGLHEESFQWIQQYFKNRHVKMAPNNVKQAYLPVGSIPIPNLNGTAPGCIIEKENKILMMFPGPPYELKPMFEETAKPYLRKKSPYIIHSKELQIVGIGESNLEELIKDLIERQSNPTIAPYAKSGQVMLRITAKASSLEEAETSISPIVKELYDRLEHKIYTEENKSLEEIVVELLEEKNLSLTTAESCTGGMVASTLINVSGASKVYEQGVITYSNSAKEKMLKMKKETLDAFGAVSKETAMEMARGALALGGTSLGLSVTGIAGPSGGTEAKPVGLVYVALASEKDMLVEELHLSGNRQKIRHLTTTKALDLLRNYLLKI